MQFDSSPANGDAGIRNSGFGLGFDLCKALGSTPGGSLPFVRETTLCTTEEVTCYHGI